MGQGQQAQQSHQKNLVATQPYDTSRSAPEVVDRVQLVNAYRLHVLNGEFDTKNDLVNGKDVKNVTEATGGVVVVDGKGKRHFIGHANIRGFSWR